eukprot:1155740-Pelagomonas_calceolata.AAC.1
MCCLLAPQFLALQSTAAVPQHVGQLARAHKGVTLLFMDIVGFTQMSKVCVVAPNWMSEVQMQNPLA